MRPIVFQSQRRKIRKGRADHGPRYCSTQLPLQHLDLTIGGECDSVVL
ncbi:hypothetical protein T01_8771 [Trichinella spiralis]|uniref:Uncharacterized protein n=1 Tax=Trichinella spiralis TaxID=6334 RepID=A0A0V0YU49_TRISP|nr:hypothetical protein T01_8771 [Trichinella spiralis]